MAVPFSLRLFDLLQKVAITDALATTWLACTRLHPRRPLEKGYGQKVLEMVRTPTPGSHTDPQQLNIRRQQAYCCFHWIQLCIHGCCLSACCPELALSCRSSATWQCHCMRLSWHVDEHFQTPAAANADVHVHNAPTLVAGLHANRLRRIATYITMWQPYTSTCRVLVYTSHKYNCTSSPPMLARLRLLSFTSIVVQKTERDHAHNLA